MSAKISYRHVLQKVRPILRRVPGALALARLLFLTIPQKLTSLRYRTQLHVLDELVMFAPASAGAVSELFSLTLHSSRETMQLLAKMSREKYGGFNTVLLDANTFSDQETRFCQAKLKEAFQHHKSDKSTIHNYHLLYGWLLRDFGNVSKVLEIGLGTNNENIVSNMGRTGSPGASVRAFRDALPAAEIFGADIDTSILFQEQRIHTFEVDQTDRDSLDKLGNHVGDDFDLIIDDGLHSPGANLQVLQFALPRLKGGGTLVIEDVARSSLPVWTVVWAMLQNHEMTVFESTEKFLIVLKNTGLRDAAEF